MAYVLPLRLKIEGVEKGSDGIIVDSLVRDAKGTSVIRKSITVGAHQTAATISAIVQHEIDVLAAAMFRRKEAELPASDQEDHAVDLKNLVGQEFVGSVVT